MRGQSLNLSSSGPSIVLDRTGLFPDAVCTVAYVSGVGCRSKPTDSSNSRDDLHHQRDRRLLHGAILLSTTF